MYPSDAYLQATGSTPGPSAAVVFATHVGKRIFPVASGLRDSGFGNDASRTEWAVRGCGEITEVRRKMGGGDDSVDMRWKIRGDRIVASTESGAMSLQAGGEGHWGWEEFGMCGAHGTVAFFFEAQPGGELGVGTVGL